MLWLQCRGPAPGSHWGPQTPGLSLLSLWIRLGYNGEAPGIDNVEMVIKWSGVYYMYVIDYMQLWLHYITVELI